MEHFETYPAYAKRLTQIGQARGWRWQTLGHVGPERFPLHGIRIPGKKGTVVLSAGIHGDERSGPHAMLQFLETHRPRKTDPTLMMFPCLNPSGFDRNRRRTAERRDPNRHWTDRAAHVPMHAMVKRALQHETIADALSLHEDDRTKFFLYVIGREYESAYRRILEAGGSVVPVHQGRNVYANVSERGLVYDQHHSLEDWMHARGARLNVCAEAPAYVPFETRVKLNIAVVRRFLALC